MIILADDLSPTATADELWAALMKERTEHAHTLRMLSNKHEQLVEMRERFARYKGKKKATRYKRKENQAGLPAAIREETKK